MRNRKKLYPETVNPTLTFELKEFLSKYSQESGRTENDVIRNWVDDLQDNNNIIKELKKYCY